MKKMLVVFLFLLSAVCAYASDAPNPVTLTISADKTAYEVGDEILIQNSLKNVSTEPVKVFDPTFVPYPSGLYSNETGVHFSLVDPEGKTSKIFAFDQRQAIYPWQEKNVRTLAPNETLEAKPFRIACTSENTLEPKEITWFLQDPENKKEFHGVNCYDLTSKPGKYTITAAYKSSGGQFFDADTRSERMVNAWSGEVTSNTLTIEIKKKANESDAQNVNSMEKIKESDVQNVNSTEKAVVK